MYRAVERCHTPGKSVVAASSLGFGALAAQETLGVPVVSVHLSPVVFRSEHECSVLPGLYMPPWLPGVLKRWQWRLVDVAVADRLLAPGINEFRAELGLSPVRRVLHDFIHSPRRVLGLFPAWFADAQPDWPAQTVLTGFPLYDERGATQMAPELDEFLAAGEPPIVFTPGSAMIHGQSFFTAAVAACRLLKRRGLLLTRFAEQVPTALPPYVRHFDFAPFSEILPRCAALAHHGGVGTLSQALAAGVPQLVMPMSHDQPDNAARLERLGVAATVWPKHFQGMTVAREFARLLESGDVQSRCRAIADQMRCEEPLSATCDEIERAALLAGAPDGCENQPSASSSA